MSYSPEQEAVAFVRHNLIASGALAEVVNEVKRHHDEQPNDLILIFNGKNSAVIEIDLRGTMKEVFDRFFEKKAEAVAAPAPKKPGRPKLGVVSKEVTLLPKHWDWLRSQRGGASVTLRKLVGEAMKIVDHDQERRRLQSVTYGLMTAVAGDLPNFEEATRALFANDGEKFGAEIEAWPKGLRDHIQHITAGVFVEPEQDT